MSRHRSGEPPRSGTRAAARRSLGSLLLLSVALLLAGCATAPAPSSSTSNAPGQPPAIAESLKNLGIASPDSLLRAETTLGESTAGYSTYGLELSYVTYKMIQILYPLYLKPEYVIYPPAGSIFPSLFNEVQQGRFPSVSQSDVSFLTLIIPPLAVLYTKAPDVVASSLEALDHAEKLNPNSVLPPYLKGVIDEQQGKQAEALVEYGRALAVDSSCYPAAIGRARILLAEKKLEAAQSIVDRLVSSIPPDATVFRLQAQIRFDLGNTTAAAEAVQRALKLAPDDAPTLILAGQIDEARKDYGTALADLASAEKIGGATPKTVLLRAEIQRKRGNAAAAVQILAAGVKEFPKDTALADAYGKALVESGQAIEGGKYLAPGSAQTAPGPDHLEVLLTDAINSKNWKLAVGYLPELLKLQTNEHTLQQAYQVYHALKDTKKALEYAHKLHNLSPQNGSYLVEYLRGLIDEGNRAKALQLIDANLAQGGLPDTMSSLYYLRSQLQKEPALELHDLRSALFENLENENALIAIARYYLRAGDRGSAQSYAQQAQSFLPTGEHLPADLQQLLSGTVNGK